MIYEIIGITIIILVVLLCIKNTVTFINTEKILNAILLYGLDCSNNNCEPLVTPDDM